MKKIFLATILVTLLFAVQPAVAMPGILVDNGDFEVPEVTAGPEWDIYDSGTAGLGWTVEWRSDIPGSWGGYTRPDPAHLELHCGVLGKANTGLQYAELDTDWNGHVGTLNNEPASVKIYQNIQTCEYGGYYTLSYAWSPRPKHGDNELEVYWDGSLIATHSGSGSSDPVWTVETHSNLIGIGSTELAFVETAKSDSLGMFLDSVSVEQYGNCGPGTITVDKTASSYEILAGETVTYTYSITNPGDFPLSNVTVDNECSLVTGPTGDTNGNNLLDTDETWVYTCLKALTETTTNTATASAYDPFENEVSDQDSVTVAVRRNICTVTQGYWKTHSKYGPAPYDSDWGYVGEDTLFFLSDQSYYEVLWTAPKKGNAYYILAHQYIAAELNGADMTDVQDAYDEATELFGIHTPSAIGNLKGNDSLRQQFISLAEILDDYNNGLIGPGHCSEM